MEGDLLAVREDGKVGQVVHADSIDTSGAYVYIRMPRTVEGWGIPSWPQSTGTWTKEGLTLIPAPGLRCRLCGLPQLEGGRCILAADHAVGRILGKLERPNNAG